MKRNIFLITILFIFQSCVNRTLLHEAPFSEGKYKVKANLICTDGFQAYFDSTNTHLNLFFDSSIISYDSEDGIAQIDTLGNDFPYFLPGDLSYTTFHRTYDESCCDSWSKANSHLILTKDYTTLHYFSQSAIPYSPIYSGKLISTKNNDRYYKVAARNTSESDFEYCKLHIN